MVEGFTVVVSTCLIRLTVFGLECLQSVALFIQGPDVEGEGGDRADMELPGNQSNLLIDVMTNGNGCIMLLSALLHHVLMMLQL